MREQIIGNCRLILGDCREMLRQLPEKSVNCCVTSPPYFGLRDYGHEDQIGLEATPDEFVAAMVEVFREVKRVLRDDGTLWLNLGDSYAGSGAGKNGNVQGRQRGNVGSRESWKSDAHKRHNPPLGLKQKDLIGIPWRVAFALQADGWYLRQDIIWHKPNPMPESVTDRCTKAHEYIFLLSKSEKYYYDADVIKEPVSDNLITRARNKRSDKGIVGRADLHGTKFGQSGNGGFERDAVETRNKRSVWTVATKPYAGAHFATFPPDLIQPCILAGCPEMGVVLDPFGGAGTTAIAAHKENRQAIIIELNPEYADLAKARIQTETEQLNLFAPPSTLIDAGL